MLKQPKSDDERALLDALVDIDRAIKRGETYEGIVGYIQVRTIIALQPYYEDEWQQK